MIALIDNYDSFTYNIYQYLREITDEEVRVFRNDRVTVQELKALKPSHVILSPGPGRPEEAGITLEAAAYFLGKVPLLGICLGHQAMVQALGGRIVQARRIVHGKTEEMDHDGRGIFRRLPQRSRFTRYHSLAAEEATLPSCLEISARADDGEIMGVRHRSHTAEGVQFHPESVGSEGGRELLKNFLNYKREPLARTALLKKVLDRRDLAEEEAAEFMDELTEGKLSPAFTASLLTALQAKGVRPQELAGCARVLARKKTKVSVPGKTLDMCGTGGDGRGTFNISSFSALLAAAAGVPVAKHGNRAVSSRSGSSDFYEALGIPVESSPGEAARMVRELNFSFLFAPLFHGAMRFAAPVRKEMGIKTMMNLLGPLANPAEAECQLIGVYHSDLCPLMARAARLLGVRRIMTVHSRDGLDEISPAAPSRIFFIDQDGRESDGSFDPADLGITGIRTEELEGAGAEENAAAAQALLEGGGSRAYREACCLNAGAALFVYGSCSSIEEGYRQASEALKDGRAARLVQALRQRKEEAPR